MGDALRRCGTCGRYQRRHAVGSDHGECIVDVEHVTPRRVDEYCARWSDDALLWPTDADDAT